MRRAVSCSARCERFGDAHLAAATLGLQPQPRSQQETRRHNHARTEKVSHHPFLHSISSLSGTLLIQTGRNAERTRLPANNLAACTRTGCSVQDFELRWFVDCWLRLVGLSSAVVPSIAQLNQIRGWKLAGIRQLPPAPQNRRMRAGQAVRFRRCGANRVASQR